MDLWDSFIDLFIGGLIGLSQLYNGNMGLAILTLSLMIRFALLPLSLKLSYRSLLHQRQLKQLQPELERLRVRYKDKPEQLARETIKLYQRHGVKPFDFTSLLGGLLQAPIFIGIFSAIRRGVGPGHRFFWIADLAQPDLIVVILVTLLSYLTAILSPNLSKQAHPLMMWVPVLLTAIFLWRLSAAVGLYWVASNLVSVVQAGLLQRKSRDLMRQAQ